METKETFNLLWVSCGKKTVEYVKFVSLYEQCCGILRMCPSFCAWNYCLTTVPLCYDWWYAIFYQPLNYNGLVVWYLRTITNLACLWIFSWPFSYSLCFVAEAHLHDRFLIFSSSRLCYVYKHPLTVVSLLNLFKSWNCLGKYSHGFLPFCSILNHMISWSWSFS